MIILLSILIMNSQDMLFAYSILSVIINVVYKILRIVVMILIVRY